MDRKNNMVRVFHMLMLLCCAMFFIGAKREVSASSGFVTTLGRDETEYTKYDITNDGKKDIIQLKKLGKDTDWYNYFKVYINGKCALSIKEVFFNADVQYIQLSNGKAYLFIHLGSDNDDGPNDIYMYKKGKLKKAVDLIKPISGIMGYHSGAEIRSVKGNKVYVDMESMSYGLASMKYEAIYNYKAGKLVLQSKKHKILGYFAYLDDQLSDIGIHTLTSTKAIQLYKSAQLMQKSIKLKTGTKLKVKRCYISGKKISFYVETLNGKKGWFRSPKDTTSKMFEEIMYAG